MTMTATQARNYAIAISNKYTDDSIAGISGVLAGKNCTIESQTHQNGRNTIVFKWTADDGTVRRNTMIVLDGTPIYVWTSGDHYDYGDLAIYSSCFYRCITPNDDIEFDDTKWNEIGSPDGNYDIVQNSELLPPVFTSADRKMYFSIEDGLFYLWNGEGWVLQKPKWNDITGKPAFAAVATSGSYGDLKDTPEIPTKTSDLINDSDFVSDANYVHTDNNYDATAKGIVDGVSTALNGKVDKVENKGLSTNDYTNGDKAIVDNVTPSLATKVDKVEGKGLSTNDYDDTAKAIVDGVSTALNGKVDKVTGKGLSKNDYTDTDKAIVTGIDAVLNTKVDKVQGKQLSTNDYTSEEKLKLAGLENYDDTEITGRVSDVESVIPSTATTSNKLATSNDIPDVSNFITNTVNNLVNYYTKAQTYTQDEVDALISAIVTLDIKVVEELPTTEISTTTIYLVPNDDPETQNAKDEYINTTGTSEGWELIGSTVIDLSDYVTNEDLTTALAGYTTTANLTTLLAAKQNVISDLATIRSGASAGATAYQKPSTGIPKTDLASAVQTSLGKADTAIQDISGKADKVSGATSGDVATLNASGNLVDSGKTLGKSVPSDAVFTDTKNTAGSTDTSSKIYLIGATSQAANPQTYSQDTAYVGTDGCLYSGGTKVLTAHQSISGKADKVTSATNGNFAGLDSNGNLTDSGHKHSDYLTQHQDISGKLDKTTYEWNKDISFGSSGYLKIGSFPMGDTNLTIEVDSTTSNSYHGTVIIATQNVSTSSMGSAHSVRIYDDPYENIKNKFRVVWTSGSRNYDVYFVPESWSKNLIHIRACNLYGEPSDICISMSGTAPSSTTGLEPVNALSTKADKVSGATSGNVATLDANGNLVDSNKTLGKSVPSDAVFTDTNTKVTQTNTTGSADYRVLLSENANDTTQTVGARKSANFKANPSTGVLSTPKVKISKSTNALITGSGTAGSDKGSGVSPRYYPAKWTFNLGGDPADGDIITIKIPVAGGTYSEWLSTDNGTTYHPIALNGKSRITSQYAVNTYLTLIYESSGVCTTYALAGADAVTDVTGTWRVINYYDSNTTYSSMSQSEATTGTATTGRIISAKVLNDTISNKISDKADKTVPSESGNVAALDENGNLTDSGFTLGKSVPSTAKFSDANVGQYATVDSNDYRVLLSYSASDNTETDVVRKSSNFKFNHGTGNLQVPKINGVTVGSSPKFTDTTYDSMTQSEADTGTATTARIITPKVLNDTIQNKASSNIATPYNSSTAYAVGNYLIYNNVLYKVKTACTGVTPPNSTYYDVITAMAEMNTRVTSLQSSLSTSIGTRVYVPYYRLRPSEGVCTLTITMYLNTAANWPNRLTYTLGLFANSSKWFFNHSTNNFFTGVTAGSGGPYPETNKIGKDNYIFNPVDTSNYYNKQFIHTIPLEINSWIRLITYRDNHDNTSTCNWYRGRGSSATLIGKGKYLYMQVKSASVSINLYQDATADYPTSTSANTNRYIYVNSGTIDHYVSDSDVQ